MPISYKIDTGRKLIFVTLLGNVTDDEVREHHNAMRSDPAFDPSFGRFVDCSGTEHSTVSVPSLRRAALRVKSDVGRKTAIYAPRDLSFGMAKMFEAMTADSPGDTKVFRTIEETKEWLGID